MGGGENLVSSAFAGIAGYLTTGVSLLVTFAGDEPLATTAGSVMAASWDPPLLAVMFRAGSRMERALCRSRRFTVNILAETDAGLARRFSRPDRGRGWAVLADVELLRRDPSPPVLTGAAVWAECVVTQTVVMGDHRCFVGEVVASGRRRDAAPLVYHRGRFRRLGGAVAPATWSLAETADLAAMW